MYNIVCLFLFLTGLQPVTPGDGPHLPQVRLCAKKIEAIFFSLMSMKLNKATKSFSILVRLLKMIDYLTQFPVPYIQ